MLEVGVLQALAHQAHGDVPQALAALGRALDGAPEPEGYVRLYLSEGPPMAALLHRVATVRGSQGRQGDAVRAQARRLLARTPVHVAATPPGQSSAEQLSQRELEVLRLLSTDLTGPQIARELYVTLNTMRTHTRHIFSKLDVNTRAAAVRRAAERGLLPTSVSRRVAGSAGEPRGR